MRRVFSGILGIAQPADRINLNDGQFTTGWVIVDLQVWPAPNSVAGGIFFATVATEDSTSVNSFDVTDTRHMAIQFYNNATLESRTLIKPDRVIIDDVYVKAGTTGGLDEVAYMLTLEKVSLTELEGYMQVLKEAGQSGRE